VPILCAADRGVWRFERVPPREDERRQLLDEWTALDPARRDALLDPFAVAGPEERDEPEEQRPESLGVVSRELQPVPRPHGLAESVSAGDRSSIARPGDRNPIAIRRTVLGSAAVELGHNVTEL
jgi:hypothetical protein